MVSHLKQLCLVIIDKDHENVTCVKTLVIVESVPLVEALLTKITRILLHSIVHIHVVLK